MTRPDVARLRAAIRARLAQGLTPAAVARQLGCARSTVYRVARAPGDDRRAIPHNRTPAALVDAVRAAVARDREVSAEELAEQLASARRRGELAVPVPSRATLSRLLRQARGPMRHPDGSPILRRPRRRPPPRLPLRLACTLPPPELVRGIVELRAEVRAIARDLADPGLTLRERMQVRREIADVVAAIIPLTRALSRLAEAEKPAESTPPSSAALDYLAALRARSGTARTPLRPAA